jgi:peptide deformylase
MALLDVRVLGDPVLRRETAIVHEVTDAHRRLVDDMFETMYAANGIGLAAPQVGRLERIAVVDVGEEGPGRIALINPEIVREEGETRGEEGCLSIPEIYGEVTRSAKVTVRALDRDGKEFAIEAEGLLAVCLQHEIDHLHGKLFIDYLSLLKRRSALSKWEKMKVQYPNFVKRLSPAEVAQHHRMGEDTL